MTLTVFGIEAVSSPPAAFTIAVSSVSKDNLECAVTGVLRQPCAFGGGASAAEIVGVPSAIVNGALVIEAELSARSVARAHRLGVRDQVTHGGDVTRGHG